jgi:hypothetical protein
MYALAIVATTAAASLASWFLYLRFLRYVVDRTGSVRELEYAAKAARAYREGWLGQLADAIARAFRRSR